jgi:hypothetical protein
MSFWVRAGERHVRIQLKDRLLGDIESFGIADIFSR